ncbi:MAG: flippase-like domain-containing protein [Lentimicrobiaceae bacterium]|nr:flippase-like domain-containing protein [Lentimicrobiaceae bacterium]
MKKYKDILKLVLFLSLGIFFVWFSVKDLSPEQRSDMVSNAVGALHGSNWILLVLCLLVCFLSVVFRALRSVLMIEPLGYKISKTNSYHSVTICYLANLAFPRLGEILRSTILQQYEKVPIEKSFGTIVTERIIDMLIFTLLLVGAFFLESDKLLRIFTENNAYEKIATMLSGTGKYITAGIILFIVLLVYVFRKKIVSNALVQKIVKILKGFWEGLVSVRKVRKPWLFVFYSVMIWACYYFAFYICVFMFPSLMVLGSVALTATLTCVAVGAIGFMVSQGGLGAYPLLVASVLLLYGIKTEEGLAIGWVVWSIETVLYLALGVVSLIVLSVQKTGGK